MRGPENKNFIEISRHLPDQDDLRNGRDSSLNPEKHRESEPIAEKLITETKKDGKKIIVFISSPKKRATETVSLVVSKIKSEAPEIKTLVRVDDRLSEIDQGIFNLPKDYNQGDKMPVLEEAWRTFFEETFTNKNYGYRFGDSSLQGDGSYKYPKFHAFFIKAGESYAMQSVRLYSAALDLYRNQKILEKAKLVVVTHGAPLAIFKDLEDISREMLENDGDLPEGQLMQLTWDKFQQRARDVSEKHGSTETISVDGLLNEKIAISLEKEIEYIRSVYINNK